jgi:hypothetical protein
VQGHAGENETSAIGNAAASGRDLGAMRRAMKDREAARQRHDGRRPDASRNDERPQDHEGDCNAGLCRRNLDPIVPDPLPTSIMAMKLAGTGQKVRLRWIEVFEGSCFADERIGIGHADRIRSRVG